MFARFASIAAVKNSKKNWDPTEERNIIYNKNLAEELKILQCHAQIFTFRTLPWTLWIIAFFTLLLAFYLNYFLIYIAAKQE